MPRDYYEVLGVPRDAAEKDIKKAYRKSALENHPDRNQGDPQSEERFKEAAEAYEVLSDRDKRARYDQFGHAGVKGATHAGAWSVDDIFSQFGDVFGDLFGGAFGGFQRGGGPQRGAHLRMEMALTLDEIFTGTTKTVTIQRHETCARCGGNGGEPGHDPEACGTCGGHGQVRRGSGFFVMQTVCPACRGRGSVITVNCRECTGEGRTRRKRDIDIHVPAGVEDESQMRLSGEGDAPHGGGPQGDLYCVFRTKPHDFFIRREGADLWCEVPLDFAQATLGTKLEIKTLEGEAALTIPGGTETGKVFRLRSQGLPSARGRGRGHQFVRVYVDVPTSPTAQQKDLLREFGRIERERREKQTRSVFDRVKEIFE